MVSIDKLALVARILYDERIIEQRQEIEFLRLKLFWKDHDERSFKRYMAAANNINSLCMCTCCMLRGRTHAMEEGDAPNPGHDGCLFAPWFEEQMLSCGLVSERMTQNHTPSIWYHESLPRADCIEADCHIVNHYDFSSIRFGKWLWEPTSADDPELQKLSMLKTLLLHIEDDDDDAANDANE